MMPTNHEISSVENPERLSNELNAFAALEAAEADQVMLEQQEMDAATQIAETPEMTAEQQEMDEGGRLGYSSEYYKHEMASAIKNGNEIAYKNAEKNYAKALVKERTREIERKTKK